MKLLWHREWLGRFHGGRWTLESSLYCSWVSEMMCCGAINSVARTLGPHPTARAVTEDPP